MASVRTKATGMKVGLGHSELTSRISTRQQWLKGCGIEGGQTGDRSA